MHLFEIRVNNLILTHKYDLIKENNKFVLLEFGGVLWG